MTRSITSPTHLRDTQLLRTIAEMREADRLSPSEDEDEPDENRHVCLTCRRFTALGRYDRMTLNTLHLRSDLCDTWSHLLAPDVSGVCLVWSWAHGHGMVTLQEHIDARNAELSASRSGQMTLWG